MLRKNLFVVLSFILTVQIGSDPLDNDYLWDHPDEVEVPKQSLAFTLRKFAQVKS